MKHIAPIFSISDMMPVDSFCIRRLEKQDLSELDRLTPPEWDINLLQVYEQHMGQPYFYPVVVAFDNEIVGTGIANINKNTTWLGTIVVKDRFRNKGIGNLITNELIKLSLNLGIKRINLVASELGRSLYQKLGFIHDSSYLFFSRDNSLRVEYNDEGVLPISSKDYNEIFELDLLASGEARKSLLLHTMQTGYKYILGNKIEGFYLPDFGKGLIIANAKHAGLSLLKFSIARGNRVICIPEKNILAIEFLQKMKFRHYKTSSRMYLSENTPWMSEYVYSRGCGYFG